MAGVLRPLKDRSPLVHSGRSRIRVLDGFSLRLPARGHGPFWALSRPILGRPSPFAAGGPARPQASQARSVTVERDRPRRLFAARSVQRLDIGGRQASARPAVPRASIRGLYPGFSCGSGGS